MPHYVYFHHYCSIIGDGEARSSRTDSDAPELGPPHSSKDTNIANPSFRTCLRCVRHPPMPPSMHAAGVVNSTMYVHVSNSSTETTLSSNPHLNST